MVSTSPRRLSVAAFYLLFLSACDGTPPTLRIVLPTEPVHASIVAEISALLGDDASVRVEVTGSTLAEAAGFDAVESGEADLALVSNSLPFRSNIATVMPLYPTLLHIVSRRDVGTVHVPDTLRGASIAAVRIFRIRRKNPIDRFYSKTIALRRSVNASSDPQDVQRITREIRDLQNQALDLLVDEKLAADESFRIFVTLSNDALRQLGDTDDPVRISDN